MKNAKKHFTFDNATFKNVSYVTGAIIKFKKSVGWTIDKFWLNNSMVINGTILSFAYQKMDDQRRTFSSFWDFCCSYHE